MKTRNNHRETLVYHHLQISTHKLKEKENKGMLKAFKNSTNIRPTHLTERAKGSDQQVNLQEERKPHTILSTKKAKERSRRLCYLLPPKNGSFSLTSSSGWRYIHIIPPPRPCPEKGPCALAWYGKSWYRGQKKGEKERERGIYILLFFLLLEPASVIPIACTY